MDLFDLEPQRTAHRLSALAWSFREARVLQVAIRLKVFTALHQQPQSATRLAKALDTEPAMTERLLVALAALELVSHDSGIWRNTLPAALYLVEGQLLYQGEAIELAAEVWNSYHQLESMVRKGRQRENRLFSLHQHPDWQARYARAMHALAVAGEAQRLARLVTPLAGRRTLLAVGGAACTDSVALCQRFAALRATVLDSGEMLAEGRAIVERFGPAERIALKEGNWREDSFGRNEYEALLLSHLLLESESQALVPLMKAYEALKGQGLLIVQCSLLDNDLNGGRAPALSNVLDHILTLDQMRGVMAEAGFERISILFRHPDESDILIAYKAAEAAEESPKELMEFMSPEQEMFALMGLGEEELAIGLSTHRRAWERLVQTN